VVEEEVIPTPLPAPVIVEPEVVVAVVEEPEVKP